MAANYLSAAYLFWTFFLGPLLAFPLAVAFMTSPYGFSGKSISRDVRLLQLVCGITLAGEALPTVYAPHDSAPIVCTILALVLVAMRHWQTLHFHGKPFGVFIVLAVPALSLLLLILVAGVCTIGRPRWPATPDNGMLTWCSHMRTNTERALIVAKLMRYPSRQLGVVRQKNIHSNNFFEWV